MVQGRAGTGDVVPLMVRVPEDMRDRIRAAAEAAGRSMNSEIVATLEEKYPAPPPLSEARRKQALKALSILRQMQEEGLLSARPVTLSDMDEAQVAEFVRRLGPDPGDLE